MKRLLVTAVIFICVACTNSDLVDAQSAEQNRVTASTLTPAKIPQRPNIVLIVADDLGYTDIGALGSEIRTPNLDALAGQGLMLSGFHTGPSCGPTRSMLLSGTDSHIAGTGVNAAGLVRLPFLRQRPGYEGYLNHKVVSFANLLQDSGYHTYMTGKWDLGKKPGYLPKDRGFDQSFSMGDGGASHFADKRGIMEQIDPVAYYDNASVVQSLPEDFYSSDFYTNRMIEYVDQTPDDEPFLAYLAYTAPHWPLQVPDDWLDRYKGSYDKGWDQIRAERFARMKALGLVPDAAQLGERMPQVPAWNELSPENRAIEIKRMEIYAAMIEYMDMQIGRFIEHLKQSGKYDNTLIVFFSDNGAEGNNIGTLGTNEKWLPMTFDNSLQNMGRRGSYVWLDAGWAQASVTPGRLFKSFTTEGGIHTPAIISWPGMDRKGEREDAFVTVMDIAPTLLEIAGVVHPAPNYQGKPVEPMLGTSMRPLLEDGKDIHGPNEAFGVELYGRRSMRKGDWKIIWIFPPNGPGTWELINISQDPSEQNDLSEENPEKLAELIAEWDAYVERAGVYVFDKDVGY